MTTIVEPKPEFRMLSDQEVRTALDDPDPNNPIACEVARLVHGYAKNFEAFVHRTGRVPTDVMHVSPRWPIEAIAMQLMAETVRSSLKNAPAPQK